MTEIRLQPLSEQHLEPLRRMLDDPVTVRFTRVPDPVPDGFEHQWYAGYVAGRAEGTREVFAVLEDDAFLGIGVAPDISRSERTVELGYIVDAAQRGRGVATATLLGLTHWAFAELDPVRVELLISEANAASKAVARRCGYTYEGTLRSKFMKAGVWEDTTVWSRLAGE
ncbi:MAG: GNAT family N-acetyltransferase [Marmoricola sp.]